MTNPGPDLATLSRDVVRALFLAAVRNPDGSCDETAMRGACWLARGDEVLWRHVAEEAEFHGISSLIQPAIEAAAAADPALVPDVARRSFAILRSRHRRIFALREAWIDRLLATTASAGLEVVLLKGAALAHAIYREPDRRPMVDIDLLIRPADAEPARRCLETLGFAFDTAYGSRFAGTLHHLPAARLVEGGLPVSVELHTDTMSPDQADSLTFATLSAPLRRVERGSGPRGWCLGHTDMLRHLARHSFEPSAQIRLIHLLDLWLYRQRFAAEIDWPHIAERYPGVMVVLDLVEDFFARGSALSPGWRAEGIGLGMIPLSELASTPMSLWRKLRALLAPSPWWMRGYYGVAPGRSLVACRAIRHPATVAGWLLRRGMTGAGLASARNGGAPVNPKLATSRPGLPA